MVNTDVQYSSHDYSDNDSTHPISDGDWEKFKSTKDVSFKTTSVH